MSTRCWLTTVVVLICMPLMALNAAEATKDATIELLTHIFAANRYDRRIRPFDDGDEEKVSVVVEITLLVGHLIDLVLADKFP
jgi:hypothetical protein